MKKTYINPETITVAVKTERLLNLTSVHNAFNEDDVTYSRRHTNDVWDDEEEDF